MNAKLPFSARRVVNASRLLSDGAVRVWLELYALDQGADGAYIGAGPLARRLGRSRETVERHRVQLLALGLLRKTQRPGRRTASWYCQLPADCLPLGHRPTDDEIVALAGRLDHHLAPTGVSADAGRRDEPASLLTPVAPSATTPPTGVRADDLEEGRRSDPPSHPSPEGGAVTRGAGEPRRAAASATPESGATTALPGNARTGLTAIAAALAPHDRRAAQYLRHAAGAALVVPVIPTSPELPLEGCGSGAPIGGARHHHRLTNDLSSDREPPADHGEDDATRAERAAPQAGA